MRKHALSIVALLIMVALAFGSAGGDSSSETTEESTNESLPESTTIPGLAAVDLTGNLEPQGFKISKRLGGQQSEWNAKKQNGSLTYLAEAFGRSADNISSIDASAFGGVLDDSAVEFVGFVASIPYEGSDPKKATQWVKSNFAKRAEKPSVVIGPCKYELFGSEFSVLLSIRPVE